MHRGTNVGRHPWFASRIERLIASIPNLVMHRTVTRNYGLAGGYIECSFWTHENGAPTGIATSSWRLEP